WYRSSPSCKRRSTVPERSSRSNQRAPALQNTPERSQVTNRVWPGCTDEQCSKFAQVLGIGHERGHRMPQLLADVLLAKVSRPSRRGVGLLFRPRHERLEEGLRAAGDLVAVAEEREERLGVPCERLPGCAVRRRLGIRRRCGDQGRKLPRSGLVAVIG